MLSQWVKLALSRGLIFLMRLSQLVNTEHDSLQENARVQECLEQAKIVRKQIVRYIQVCVKAIDGDCGPDSHFHSLWRMKT